MKLLKKDPLKKRKYQKESQKHVDPNILACRERLQEALGTKVELRHDVETERGTVVIDYYSLDDLERIMDKFE